MPMTLDIALVIGSYILITLLGFLWGYKRAKEKPTCLFGCDKKYVGIEEVPLRRDDNRQCPHGWYKIWEHCDFCKVFGQVAHWVCRRCEKMDRTIIRRSSGVFMVEFGKLVPDEKRWANQTFYKDGL